MGFHIYKVLLLWLWVLTATDAEGVQCPSCTYSGVDAMIVLENPFCKSRPTGIFSWIETKTCAPRHGMVVMCSHYDVHIEYTKTTFGIIKTKHEADVYHQGCFYTLPGNAPGCHDIKNKSSIMRILEEDGTPVKDIVSFGGKVCVYNMAGIPQYNMTGIPQYNMAGIPQFGVLLPMSVLAQVVAMILLF